MVVQMPYPRSILGSLTLSVIVYGVLTYLTKPVDAQTDSYVDKVCANKTYVAFGLGIGVFLLNMYACNNKEVKGPSVSAAL